MRHVKNIIFDLGGVIIGLDVKKTISEFNKLSYMPFEDFYLDANRSQLFAAFDKGEISEAGFFKVLADELRFSGPPEVMLKAWNAMLLDVPENRLDMLVELKQDYNTFLLSNTCEPHITAFEHDLYIRHGVRNFNDYFDKVYYSCRIGMRKPDREIFEFILGDNSLNPNETIFIDDTEQHVKAAGACGINSYLLPKNTEISDFLKELGLLSL